VRARLAALLLLSIVLPGCGSPPAMGPMTCSAWHCDLPSSAPLAWTRPDGGQPGRLDISRTGDLCEKHAAKSPFALAGRFAFVFGIVPAFAFAYLSFRVLWIVDRYGPGLARFGEANGRRILFGTPAAIFLGWLVFFAIRAW